MRLALGFFSVIGVLFAALIAMLLFIVIVEGLGECAHKLRNRRRWRHFCQPPKRRVKP